MWQTVALGIWVWLLPIVVWPQLAPDTSQRLTWVALSAALGLVTCSTARRTRPLPVGWTILGVALAVTTAWRAWPVVRSGEYFRFFVETAAWSDGAIVLCAVWWGAWAWRQVPAERLRRIGPLMLGMLGLNTVFVLGQACHLPWHLGSYMAGRLTGVMGMDRLLAAYAVACLPFCFSLHPMLALWPLALIAACMKGPAWLGAAVTVYAMRPRWARMVWPIAAVGGAWAIHYAWLLRVHQRASTWWHCLKATGTHPFVGWGFSPMALHTIRLQYGPTLPSVHSDWLALAVHAGWVIAALAAVLAGYLVWARPRSDGEQSIRASLLGLLAMSSVQSVLSHPRLGSLAVLLAVWWVVERSETKESQA